MTKSREIPESFRHLPGQHPDRASHAPARHDEPDGEPVPVARFVASLGGLAVIVLAGYFTGRLDSTLFHLAGGVFGLIAAFAGGRIAVDLGREARARKDPDVAAHELWRKTDHEFERVRRGPY